MITEDKIKEIKKRLSRGVPEGEIKQELIRAGYSAEDIEKIFAPHHYDMRSWYLFFGIIVFIAGIWAYFNRHSLLGFVLSGLLFWQYYREGERLKNTKNSN
ncbi:MAG: hypothetical protein IT249_09855 [Chitinophagaceae bacterium]|nr:hypothetical protein [Chitinophagaceae bacterium]